MADSLFSLDNWLPMEPKPEDFISPPIIVWNYPTKRERHLKTQREKHAERMTDPEYRQKRKQADRERYLIKWEKNYEIRVNNLMMKREA